MENNSSIKNLESELINPYEKNALLNLITKRTFNDYAKVLTLIGQYTGNIIQGDVELFLSKENGISLLLKNTKRLRFEKLSDDNTIKKMITTYLFSKNTSNNQVTKRNDAYAFMDDCFNKYYILTKHAFERKPLMSWVENCYRVENDYLEIDRRFIDNAKVVKKFITKVV